MRDITGYFGGVNLGRDVIIVEDVAGAAASIAGSGDPDMYVIKLRGATADDPTRKIEQVYGWDIDDLCGFLVKLTGLISNTGQGDKLAELILRDLGGGPN